MTIFNINFVPATPEVNMVSALTPSGSYLRLNGNVYSVPAMFSISETVLNTHGNTTFKFLNKTFHITSTGPSVLNKPITLVIKYTDAELTAMGSLGEDRLKGFMWNPTTNSWSYLKTTVNLVGNIAEVTINQLNGSDFNMAKAPAVETVLEFWDGTQPDETTLSVLVEFSIKDIDMDGISLSYLWKLSSESNSSWKVANTSPPLTRVGGTGDIVQYSIQWNALLEPALVGKSAPQSVMFRITAADDDKTTTIVDSPKFNIILNTPPKITSNPKTSVRVGDVYSYVPTVTDKENNMSGWQVSEYPSFLTFNTTTGALTGTATATYLGTYEIVLKALDTLGFTDVQIFVINVKKK